MRVEDLHLKLDLEWNRQSNNHRKYLTDPEKDEILNKAIFEYVEMFLHGENKNLYDLGFEVTQQRIDMLQTLVRSFPEQPFMKAEKLSNDIYQIDLTKTAVPCKSAVACKFTIRDCDLQIIGDWEQHQELFSGQINFHRKSSKKWQRAIIAQRNDKLYIYTDNEFIPEDCFLTYIKIPDQVCLGTYVAFENKDNVNAPNKPKSDTDLPDDYINVVVAIAVQELNRRYSNFNELSVSQQKIKELL